jgi:hypothetical protein
VQGRLHARTCNKGGVLDTGSAPERQRPDRLISFACSGMPSTTHPPLENLAATHLGAWRLLLVLFPPFLVLSYLLGSLRVLLLPLRRHAGLVATGERAAAAGARSAEAFAAAERVGSG